MIGWSIAWCILLFPNSIKSCKWKEKGNVENDANDGATMASKRPRQLASDPNEN